MKPTENIKHKIKNTKIKTNPDVNQAVLNDLLDQLDKSKNKTPAILQPNIWRIIMKSKITKFATAAAIIIVVAISLFTFIDKAATPAWAIEQTIEALEEIGAIYISGTHYDKDEIGTDFEMWAQPNSNGSASGNYRTETGSGIIVVAIEQKNITYKYNPDENTCSVENGITATLNPWLGSSFFQIIKQATQNWQVTYDKDQETGRDCVFVTCKHSHAPGPKSWWFKFDLETKYPISFKQWTNMNFEGKPQFYAKEIIYNLELPEGLFEFEIPENAKIIKKEYEPQFSNVLNDPKYGMPVEDLTKEEACIQIVEKYWQSVIDGYWDVVNQLRPAATSAQWESKYRQNQPEEILEIGRPYQQEGCSIGTLTPCTIKVKYGKVKEIKMIIMFREINGIESCIIAGTWGSE
jgi:hypothetical protein